MSLFIKKHRSKAAKIAGIALFTLLMFVNLQITTNPNSYGDIDLFGLKISLLPDETFAEESTPCHFVLVIINEFVYCSTTGGNCCGVVVVTG